MADADRMALRFVEEAAFAVTPGSAYTGNISTVKLDRKYVLDSGAANFGVRETIYVSGMAEADSNGFKTIESITGDTDIVVVEEIGDDETDVDPVDLRTATNDIRFTGESLKQETDTVESAEIRDDRQVADVKRTSIRGAGDINFELSYGAFDTLFAAAFQTLGWSTVVQEIKTTYSLLASDNSINDSANGFLTDGFVAGQWIQMLGWAGTNNGFAKIVTVAAGKMELEFKTVTNEVAGQAITVIMGEQIVNGVDQRSFTLEKYYTDLTESARLSGMMVNELSLEIASEAIITGTMSFMGKNEVSDDGPIGPSQEAPENLVYSAVDDMYAILEQGSEIDVVSASVALNNNLRARPLVGVLGPDSMGSGKAAVSGTLRMYFETPTQMDRYLNFESTSIILIAHDSDGYGYLIEMPKVKFTDGARVAGSQNSDVIADMAFSAYRHPVQDITIRMVRFGPYSGPV